MQFTIRDDLNVETFKDLYHSPVLWKWIFLIQSRIVHEGSFNGMSPSRDVMGSIEPDPIAEGRESSDFPFHENRVKPLLVAALVLAIAALTSVLAACYVITRSANLYYPDYHNVLPPCQQRVPPRETGYKEFHANRFLQSLFLPYIRWARCINKTRILRRRPRIHRIDYREGTFARNIPDVLFFFFSSSFIIVIAATGYE